MSAARTRVVLVAGTHAWRDDGRVDWYHRDSPFVAALRAAGIEQASSDRPFVWDTDLGGIGFGSTDLLGWRAAGLNLFHYCVPPLCPDRRIPPAELHVITHSHGLQVALMAAAAGLQIQTLIDVAGPVRQDMLPVAQQARRHIAHWVHFHAGRKDRWQWFGTLFDGKVGIVRAHPLADQNIAAPEADHGSLLRDPSQCARVVAAVVAATTAEPARDAPRRTGTDT